MTKVGLLGDVHGNTPWTVYAISRLAEALADEPLKIIWQLGDFGLGSIADPRFVKRVDAALNVYDMHMLVVPGNHEDHDFIEQLEGDKLTERITLSPRGHRFTLGGRSVVTLGGGPSVDRKFRTTREQYEATQDRDPYGKLSKYFWEQEAITRADVDKIKSGGHAEIMLAHDAPFTETIERRIGGNPHGFAQEDIDYALEGRELMNEAAEAVAPKLFIHGHYHFPVYDRTTWPDGREGLIVGLDADGAANPHTESNFAVLDLDDLSVLALPDQRFRFAIQQGWSETEARALVSNF